ncbi:hypothetical protein [Fusobacterium perfoetens]|uniref:hypothetical protein n=1 Tax=Fusobacterium perfoetens TaxID=852 RepID=UPI001F2B47F2|nr:hypothetical protein [Fusobacterium perfoetens]MCF2611776.1 hypothetical protein [Fusobacterium perfoetens]
MKINIKTCEFCRYCTNVAFDDAGINYWCRNINIPLLKREKTVCDKYQQVKKFNGGNSYNFREVEEDE